MERIYIKGNKEHWEDVCKYVYGLLPKTKSDSGICGDDKAIFAKNESGGFNVYIGGIVYDAITTNPNWQEVKPWKKHYEPKPFDKVFGWNDYDPSDIRPDIFLYENDIDDKTIYVCANDCWEHIKPYNEEEYIKLFKKSTDDE